MARYLLGIDNGSTMAKAAVFATDGTELAVASRKVELLSPQPGWSERDSEKVWRDTADAIREVIAQVRINPADIACIACTGYGNGLHLVDATGRPVRNGINSMNSRARSYVERWLAVRRAERLSGLRSVSVQARRLIAAMAELASGIPLVLAAVSS